MAKGMRLTAPYYRAGAGKEEGPYCPSSSAEAHAEEAKVRSPLLKSMRSFLADSHGWANE